jgi:RND superfamily putative drug exporter
MTLVTASKNTDDRNSRPAAAPPPRCRRRLARRSTRHRWKALIIWVLLVAAAIFAGSAATRLLSDADTGAGESGRADRVIEHAGYPADITERVLIQAPKGENQQYAGKLGRRPAAHPADRR